MDAGFAILGGIIIFVMAAYVFWVIVLPIILDIIWIKRVKIGEYFGWV